ncbi:conserved hypothetical protein [Rubrivivax sp. A210]|uniref:hypothetical protein n=1 Tax=Rubrivivax sp. A210 TaxID=2772301 RepID=UPI00191B1D0A|nr:hypothetical protein [Rubrivivax sp. A210]CAD5374051.1 conserved hypothetical protein [Rubrivivax sp. A210]
MLEFVRGTHFNGRRNGLAVATILISALFAGCTTVMPPPMAGGQSAKALRAAQLAPAQVGNFKLAPGKPAAMDTEIGGGLRGGNIAAPSGSFSRHLKETLRAELQSAGLLDPQSKLLIEGQLTDSQVDAAIGTGTARLAARFQVTSEGKVLFDKEVAAEDSWDSSFVGAIAIPRAIEHYGGIYRLLVDKLLGDADFVKALKR